jgi:glycosyltransferase involved in cell wall biosynthesis
MPVEPSASNHAVVRRGSDRNGTDRVDLSLIISTYNRCDSLLTTLGRIEQQQTGAAWELIVVDNRSTDRTSKLLEQFASKTSLNLRVVRQPLAGLGNARNAGLHAAKGEILAFTDDDCLPAEDFIDETLNVFRGDPAIGFCGGRILLHDPTDQPITIKVSTVREEISAGDFIEAGVLHGANFAFRKTALLQAGGFDPFFGAGSFYSVEDIDGVARVSALGWKGVYDPGPLVFHHHGRKTLHDVASLERIYAHGRGAYYAKCILSNQWSKAAWKQWYWSLRHKSLGTLYRESVGGASFLIRNLWDRGRRFRSMSVSAQERS